MENGIVHFEIPADDPDALSGFYIQLFDWKIEKMDMGGVSYWTIVTAPTDESGMIQGPGVNGGMMNRMDPNQRPVHYVNVSSVDTYLEKARGLGATVVFEKMPVPGMGWFAQLMDPQGNVFGIWQTDATAA
jgi:predicted enzyme related to lactoylglutathione lyase